MEALCYLIGNLLLTQPQWTARTAIKHMLELGKPSALKMLTYFVKGNRIGVFQMF